MPKLEIGIRDEKSRLVSNFAKQEMDLFRFVIFFFRRDRLFLVVSRLSLSFTCLFEAKFQD